MNLVEASKESLLAFCKVVTPSFEIANHHKIISKALRKIIKGKPVRLLVSLPPRHGKTFLTTQHFPAWFLGHFPSKKVISTAYSSSLAEDFGLFVRNLMQTDSFLDIFPFSQLDISSKSKKRFNTIDGGEYFAVGRGGGITGRGGDLIILDDMIKNEAEARSEVYRKNLVEWWEKTLFTRLMPNASIVAVMTRWHEEDLIGHLLAKSSQNWEYIKMPAISPDNQPLWPERFSLETLQNIKKEIGSMAFEGLYQQNPMKQEGNLIKAEWIQYWDNLPPFFDREIITIDTSFKGTTQSDFNVLQHWGKKSNQKFMTDQVRGQFEFTELVSQIKAFVAKHPKATVYIEDTANASAVMSVLQKEIPQIKPWKPVGSKESRVIAVLPQMERGEVYFSKAYADTINELLIFPYGKNDDTVDATSMALSLLDQQVNNAIFSVAY